MKHGNMRAKRALKKIKILRSLLNSLYAYANIKPDKIKKNETPCASRDIIMEKNGVISPKNVVEQ